MDAIVALAFGFWIYALVEAPERSMPAFYAKPARLFAGFSYTLYLTHFPIVFLLRSRIIGSRVWNPSFIHFVYALLITAGATLVAYLLALGTETKTAVARRKVMALFPSARRPAPAKSWNSSLRPCTRQQKTAPSGFPPAERFTLERSVSSLLVILFYSVADVKNSRRLTARKFALYVLRLFARLYSSDPGDAAFASPAWGFFLRRDWTFDAWQKAALPSGDASKMYVSR